MKKVVLVITVSLLSNGLVAGQKFNPSDLPAAVKTAFYKQYPGTVPKWDKEDNRYEAEFKHHGKEMSAVFDLDGTLQESEMEISVNELPSVARNYVKTHYNTSIKEASKITLGSGAVEYEAEIKGKDIMFDANGNFVKEIKR